MSIDLEDFDTNLFSLRDLINQIASSASGTGKCYLKSGKFILQDNEEESKIFSLRQEKLERVPKGISGDRTAFSDIKTFSKQVE